MEVFKDRWQQKAKKFLCPIYIPRHPSVLWC